MTQLCVCVPVANARAPVAATGRASTGTARVLTTDSIISEATAELLRDSVREQFGDFSKILYRPEKWRKFT